MIRFSLCFVVFLGAIPAQAQAQAQEEEGKGLIERGVEMFLRGLMSELRPGLDGMAQAFEDLRALVDDAANYEAPVRLPNGDIVIRRKPDAPVVPLVGPQIEL